MNLIYKGEVLKDLSFNYISEARYKKELMSSHYLYFRWYSPHYVQIPAGAYVDYKGQRFTLLEPYVPQMRTEVECEYSLILESEVMGFKKHPMLFIDGGIEESEFTTDSKIEVPLTHLLRSIKKLGLTYKYRIDLDLTDNRTVNFNNTDIFSALNQIADVWECEWWVKDLTIFFGYCKDDSNLELLLGDHIKPPTHTDFGEFYSKYRVFGGTRNIEKLEAGAGVSAKARLRLPESYVNSTITVDDKTNFTTTLVFEDIYPKSNLKVTEVSKEDGLFLIKLGNFEINEEDVIKGESPKIHFNSGGLEGRDFDLEKYNEWFVVVVSSGDITFPNDTIKPEVGNDVVVYNIIMPEEYHIAASRELEEQALQYIADKKEDLRQYTANTNRVKFPYAGQIDVGTSINYTRVELSGEEEVKKEVLNTRILSFEVNLENEKDISLTFGNKRAKGAIESLKEEIKKKEAQKGKDGTSIIIKDILENTADLPINPPVGSSYWVDSVLYTWNGINWVREDLKGKPGSSGKDGSTPYIGYNDNWWVDGEDLGIKAKGEDGNTPYIKNNTWWIGSQDTGIVAHGKDGAIPTIKNGTWWIDGTDTGVKAVGEDGTSVKILGSKESPEDLPQDAEIGDGYLVDGELWIWNGEKWDNVGRIQGEDGKTPYIKNGTWWVGTEDTGIKAIGQDGSTPEIIDGYWWLNGENTGIRAEAEDGETPYIKEGFWWIGDKNTGIKAEAKDGETPYIKNGTWWVGNHDTGVKAQGDKGEDGATPYIQDGYWWIKGQNTWVVAEGEDGEDGESPYIGYDGNWWVGDTNLGISPEGKTGAITYHAGMYSSAKTYRGTATTRPLVYHKGKYWFLKDEGLFQNEEPSVSDVWGEASDYELVLTDTLIANFAKLGGAVFYGDLMMSQWGTDAIGNQSSNYDQYPDNFTPYFIVNYKTGEFTANKGTLKGHIDAYSGTIGGFEIGNGRIGAIVDPTESSFGNLAIYNDFFRVGGNNGYAMLGDNVIPASAGGAFNATGRIVNNTPNTDSGYGYETANYGLFIDVEGGTRNYGLRSNQPLLAKSFISDSVGFIDFGGSSYKVDFSQYSTFLIYSGRNVNVELPSRHSVASMFGMTSLPRNLFGFKFTFVGMSGTSQVKLIGLLNSDGSYRDYEINKSDAIDILAYTREGILYYQVLNYRT